jgi:hypothetical protein
MIQLAVREAEAPELPAEADRMSNTNVVEAGGVGSVLTPDAAVEVEGEPLLGEDAELDAGGVPQAMASKASNDAIAAARFIGISCSNGRLRVRLWAPRNGPSFDALSAP